MSLPQEIVIIFGENEKKELLFKKEEIKGNKALPVAWTPQAVDLLISLELPFKTIHSFTNHSYDPSQLTTECLKLKRMAEEIDEKLSIQLPNIQNENIQYFYSNIHRFRELLLTFENEAIKLQSIIDSLNVSSISYPENIPCRFFNIIIKKISENKYNNLKFIQFNNNKYSNHSSKWFTTHHNYLKWPKSSIKFLAKKALRKIPFHPINSHLIAQTGKYPRSKESILILDSAGHTSETIYSLRKKYNLIFWEDLRKQELYMKVDEEKLRLVLKDSTCFKVYCNRKNIDLTKEVSDIFVKTISEDYSYFYSVFINYQKFQKKFNFKFIISSYELPHWQVIYRKANSLSIPVVVYTHGGTVGFVENVFFIPLMMNNFKKPELFLYITYTKYLEEYLKEFCLKLKTASPQITHANFPHIKKIYTQTLKAHKLKNQKLKVCYLSSFLNNYCSSSIRLGDGEAASLYELRIKAIEILSRSTKIDLHYKFGYQSEQRKLPTEMKILNNNMNITPIESHISFLKSANSFDLIIFEFPSTPLYEIMTSNIPSHLFLDSRIVQLNDMILDQLSDSVTVSRDRNEFISSMQDLADKGSQSKLVIDKGAENLKLKELFHYSNEKSSDESNLLAITSFLKNI